MTNPTEQRLPDGADTFQPVVNRRAGYMDNKLAWLRDWLTRHPDATLASGEGGLLLDALNRAEIEREACYDAWQRADGDRMVLLQRLQSTQPDTA